MQSWRSCERSPQSVQSLMTIFKHSQHFSRTLGSLCWQSLNTAITSAELWCLMTILNDTTTPPQKHHTTTKTAPQKNSTTKTPPHKHHHKNTTTAPQKHHHTTTTTSILPQFSTVVRFSPVKNVHFTTIFHRSPVQSGQKRPFHLSFSP